MNSTYSISSGHRGHILQERVHKTEHRVLEQSKWTPDDRAAVVIQKIWRGHRIQVGKLKNPAYPVYRAQCIVAEFQPSLLPRAAAGTIRVYLPLNVPQIVLKDTGQKVAQERYYVMQKLRAILRKQGSSHLVIPKAALCGRFLVEQRLPIFVDKFQNMAEYLSNPHKFDCAVTELTRMLTEACLSDIVSWQLHAISNIVGDSVRYDNLPFCSDGTIGLIDLEHITFDSINQENHSNRLNSLIRIFPLHVDLIISEISKASINIDREAASEAEAKGRKFLGQGYSAHLEWLAIKDIAPAQATQMFKLSDSRKQEIFNNVLIELRAKNHLPVTDEAVLKTAIDLIMQKLEQIDKLPDRLDSSPLHSQPQSSEAAMISFRSPLFDRYDLFEEIIDLMDNPPEAYRFRFANKRDQRIEAADEVFNLVCQQLVNKEWFSYDPNYQSEKHRACWIRY